MSTEGMRGSGLRRPRVLLILNRPHVTTALDTSNMQVTGPLLECASAFEIETHVIGARDHAESEARRAVAQFRPQVVVRQQIPPELDLPARFWGDLRRDGVRVVACLYDSTVFHFEVETALFSEADCLVVLDSLSTYLEFRLLARVLGRPTGVAFASGYSHHDRFFGPGEAKRHEVLFIGTVEGQRGAFITALRQALEADGIALRIAGGLIKDEQGTSSTANWLDWDGYRREIQQARICLNMQSYRSRTQIKGRVYESMACGTFCLTDDNPDSRRYIPNHLVGWFDSVESCAAQVRHWLAHEAEREAAAKAARAWLVTTLDYRAFWSGVLRHALDPAQPPPTLPVLEAEFERLVALQPALIRQQLALITELSRLLASGEPVERMTVAREGARGSYSIVDTGDQLAAAFSRPCWDLVRAGGRRLAYLADMDPLPLDDAGMLHATRGRAAVGHRDGHALLRILDEIARRQDKGEMPRY